MYEAPRTPKTRHKLVSIDVLTEFYVLTVTRTKLNVPTLSPITRDSVNVPKLSPIARDSVNVTTLSPITRGLLLILHAITKYPTYE